MKLGPNDQMEVTDFDLNPEKVYFNNVLRFFDSALHIILLIGFVAGMFAIIKNVD